SERRRQQASRQRQRPPSQSIAYIHSLCSPLFATERLAGRRRFPGRSGSAGSTALHSCKLWLEPLPEEEVLRIAIKGRPGTRPGITRTKKNLRSIENGIENGRSCDVFVTVGRYTGSDPRPAGRDTRPGREPSNERPRIRKVESGLRVL